MHPNGNIKQFFFHLIIPNLIIANRSHVSGLRSLLKLVLGHRNDKNASDEEEELENTYNYMKSKYESLLSYHSAND